MSTYIEINSDPGEIIAKASQGQVAGDDFASDAPKRAAELQSLLDEDKCIGNDKLGRSFKKPDMTAMGANGKQLGEAHTQMWGNITGAINVLRQGDDDNAAEIEKSGS